MSFKKNNKGFTLVELIIVIAIIAILAVVVAPQYLKYVESSREATDKNAIDEIAHAAEIAAIGDGTTVVGDGKFTVKIDGTSYKATYTYSGTGESEDLAKAVAGIVAENTYVFKSKLYRAAGETVKIEIINGVAKVTYPTAAAAGGGASEST